MLNFCIFPIVVFFILKMGPTFSCDWLILPPWQTNIFGFSFFGQTTICFTNPTLNWSTLTILLTCFWWISCVLLCPKWHSTTSYSFVLLVLAEEQNGRWSASYFAVFLLCCSVFLYFSINLFNEILPSLYFSDVARVIFSSGGIFQNNLAKLRRCIYAYKPEPNALWGRCKIRSKVVNFD